MTELEKQYNIVCDEYLRRFCANYDLGGETSWVADVHGDLAIVGDYYFNFDVIKYAVDNELADFDELASWYDYSVDALTYKFHCPNFKSWHEGCPRLGIEQLKRLKALTSNIERAKEEYQNYLNNLEHE